MRSLVSEKFGRVRKEAWRKKRHISHRYLSHNMYLCFFFSICALYGFFLMDLSVKFHGIIFYPLVICEKSHSVASNPIQCMYILKIEPWMSMSLYLQHFLVSIPLLQIEYIFWLQVDACGLIIRQLFYHTEIYMKFVNDYRKIGIKCHIVPVIMPIKNYKGFIHIDGFCKTKLCHLVFPCLFSIAVNSR